MKIRHQNGKTNIEHGMEETEEVIPVGKKARFRRVLREGDAERYYSLVGTDGD